MQKYIMALDQGTTSSRAILFGKNGEMAAVSQKEFTQYFPENGWVEQDPKEIWASQMSVMMEARETLGIPVEEIAAIGITNQRETTIVWNKETGEPIYPAIVWQCRRTADRIDALKAEGYDTVIREKTGLIRIFPLRRSSGSSIMLTEQERWQSRASCISVQWIPG